MFKARHVATIRARCQAGGTAAVEPRSGLGADTRGGRTRPPAAPASPRRRSCRIRRQQPAAMTCSRAGAFLPKKNGPRRAGPRPKFATRRMQPAALGSQRTGRLVPMVGAGRRVEGGARVATSRQPAAVADPCRRRASRPAPTSSRFAPVKCADSPPSVSDRAAEVARAASSRGDAGARACAGVLRACCAASSSSIEQQLGVDPRRHVRAACDVAQDAHLTGDGSAGN